MRGKCTLVICLLVFSFKCFSQKKEIGIRGMYGIRNEKLPENAVYKPLMILPYYNRFLTPDKYRLRLSGMLEQQLVVANVEKETTGENNFEYEIGLNAGPVVSFEILRLIPYLGGMYGANLITVDTELQRNGYIFTATAFSGLKTHIGKHFFADLNFRIRHISNGGMKSPNKGIDTWFAGIGISKMY
jgi:hypothetical protein